MSSFVQIIYEEDNNDGNIPEEATLAMTPLLLEDPNTSEGVEDEFMASPLDAEENSSSAAIKEAIEWGSRDTNFLLKKYNKYIPFVGRRKKFRTKRDMWYRISQDLKHELQLDRSQFQCENRYKTVLRRWRKNTGRSENATLRTGSLKQNNHTFHSTNNTAASPMSSNESQGEAFQSRNSHKELSDVLWEIFKKKEEGRERRHKEKMELIWTLIKELDK